MATRVVEWKKPYTWWDAIDINQNKVISLKLRDENNLIIYDSWDDEIYVDLQLADWIEPTDAFPVWVTTGRVLVADEWDKTWTLICAKTTSGDNIKLLYADDGTLWIDNGTGIFKQIYLSIDIATILTDYATKEYVDAHDTIISSTEPEEPYEWMIWYNTTSDKLKVYDWTAWQDIGSWWWADIEYKTQAEYDALPSSKLTDWKHYVIYTADSPTPPWANTVLYWELLTNANDTSWNNRDGTVNGTVTWNDWAIFSWGWQISSPITTMPTDFTISVWVNKSQWSKNEQVLFAKWEWAYYEYERFGMYYNSSNTLYVRQATQPVQWQWLEVWNYWTGNWHNVVLTKTWTTLTVYVNGTQTNQFNYYDWADSPNSLWIGWWWPSSSGDWNFYWTLNKFIVEDKTRTAQEVADYYDLTKWDYGIS